MDEGTDTERVSQPDPVGMEAGTVTIPKALEQTAEHLVTELVKRRYTEDRIVAIFGNPLSGGAHVLYKAKGERWLRRLISSVRKRSATLPAKRARVGGSKKQEVTS